MNTVGTEMSQPENRPNAFTAFSRKCSELFLSKYFILALFCGACAITAAKKEVVGVAIYIGIICLALVLCEDIMATTMPFLLLCVFVTSCYDSYDTFIKFAPVAIPAALCLIFHFVYFRGRLSVGSTFWGLAAVAAALLLGGVGFISPSDYFRPMTLYYTLFLGIGMVVFYLLFKSQLSTPRKYDVRERLVSYLYVMGVLACFAVIFFLSQNIEHIRTTRTLPYLQASNNLSTILLFALPCPFFFVPKNRLHVIVPVLMYGCMVLSGARSGIILGAVELLICFIVSAWWDKPRRFTYVCCAACLVGLAILGGNAVLRLSVNVSISELISVDEARYKLLQRAKELFPQCPVFGHGLGYTGNTDLYSSVKGAMEWYHMMIPQVVAGLGIFGSIAYLFQFFLRWRCAVMALRADKASGSQSKPVIVTLFLSYIGVLLMSQVNPGLFCPLPYSLMAVMIFALLDGSDGSKLFGKKS